MSESPPEWLKQPDAEPQPQAPAWTQQPTPPPAPPAGWAQPGPGHVAGPVAHTAVAPNPVAVAAPVVSPVAPAPRPHGAPAIQPHVATLDTVKARAYAEWLTWARRQFHDLPRAQAAARGAFGAAVQGADADTAARVGTQAAANPATWPGPLDPRLEVYATWFTWAHLDMRASEELAHKAASTAAAEQARGARPELVAQAAQAVLGAAAAQHLQGGSSSFVEDAAFKPLVAGSVVLAMPIVSGLIFGRSFFFGLVFPILGITYSIRAFGRSRRPVLAATALGLNILGILATALLWFAKFSGA